jgi:hypothetical protein
MRTQRKQKLLGHAPFYYNDDILKGYNLLVLVNSAGWYTRGPNFKEILHLDMGLT